MTRLISCSVCPSCAASPSARPSAGPGTPTGSLYGYLYGLVQAEDLSLLMGAIGLFVILATVMFLTRKLDWRNLRFVS